MEEDTSESALFRCPDCNFSSRFKGILETHMENTHFEEGYLMEDTTSSNETENVQEATQELSSFPIIDADTLSSKMYVQNSTSYTKRVFRRTDEITYSTSKSNTKLQCPHCPVSTYNEDMLKSHFNLVHNNSEISPQSTPPSRRKSREEIWDDLSKTHQNDRLYCSMCDFSTIYKENLNIHVETLHSTVSTSNKRRISSMETSVRSNQNAFTQVRQNDGHFDCPFCVFSTVYKWNLKVHIATFHSSENRSSEPIGFECPFCVFSTLYQANMKIHIATVHSSKKRATIEPLSSESYGTPSPPIDNRRNYFCVLCDHFTVYMWNLRSHMKSHTDGTKNACSICSFNFSSPSSVAQHEKLHFRPDLSFTPSSNESFSPTAQSLSSTGLAKTQNAAFGESKASATRPFSCHVCNKSFIGKRHLYQHLREVHPVLKDEKASPVPNLPPLRGKQVALPRKSTSKGSKTHRAYSCHVCGKSYIWARNLKRHLKKNHDEKYQSAGPKNNNDETHVCRICHKEYKMMCHLVRHAKSHRGAETKGWSKSQFKHVARSSNELNEGREGQSNPGPRQFLIKDLIRVKSHSGTKSFVCKICALGFRELYKVTSHIVMSHPSSVLKRNPPIGSEQNPLAQSEALKKTQTDSAVASFTSTVNKDSSGDKTNEDNDDKFNEGSSNDGDSKSNEGADKSNQGGNFNEDRNESNQGGTYNEDSNESNEGENFNEASNESNEASNKSNEGGSKSNDDCTKTNNGCNSNETDSKADGKEVLEVEPQPTEETSRHSTSSGTASSNSQLRLELESDSDCTQYVAQKKRKINERHYEFDADYPGGFPGRKNWKFPKRRLFDDGPENPDTEPDPPPQKRRLRSSSLQHKFVAKDFPINIHCSSYVNLE